MNALQVDPTVRITSTLHVPPIQKSWFKDIFCQCGTIKKLPLMELVDLILEFLDILMGLEDAKSHREKLMKERKYFTNDNSMNYFEIPFSLCEH